MDENRIKILFIADTHLGYDLPSKPRIDRRRRGYDFFANYKLALQPALKQEVDLVVHGGDLFYRSKIPSGLVDKAFTPLVDIADKNIPVFIVPGNHERSKIPLHLSLIHEKIYIFEGRKYAERYSFSINIYM